MQLVQHDICWRRRACSAARILERQSATLTLDPPSLSTSILYARRALGRAVVLGILANQRARKGTHQSDRTSPRRLQASLVRSSLALPSTSCQTLGGFAHADPILLDPHERHAWQSNVASTAMTGGCCMPTVECQLSSAHRQVLTVEC